MLSCFNDLLGYNRFFLYVRERGKVGIGERNYVGLLNSTKSLRELHSVLKVNRIELEGSIFWLVGSIAFFFFLCKFKPCNSVLVLTVLD